jgi:glucosamine--fructose-6-phosphate aminotransferase (isomerizing)
MNSRETRYTQFGITRDMLESPEIVRRFDTGRMQGTAREIGQRGQLLLTGEGSSRIFPAKSVMHAAACQGWPLHLRTEAGRQAHEQELRDWSVFALSNSGRTAEVIGLFQKLAELGHQKRYSLTAFPDSRLESLATTGYVLTCGPEGAVAATKSVIEQALFYRALLEWTQGSCPLQQRLSGLADAMQAALTLEIDAALIQRIARANTIYWAGRNDGVAEELTLKTNEIARKQADFLEGTYAVHGVEEVMQADDVVLWIDPYPEFEAKFAHTLEQGVGLQIIAIADRETLFPTIRIPSAGDLSAFVQMCAGWNILIEVGLALGLNLDKPQRARKVGNEFTG